MIEQLFKKYYNNLMIIACSYTHNRTDAEDLVQETFLKAILSYKATGCFLAWAGKVLRNTFLNQARAANRNSAIPEDEEILIHLLPDRQTVLQQNQLLEDYIADEERRELSAMIAALPWKYRSVMIDSVYLEMEDAVIAKEYHTSVANIRQIRFRARKMLLKMREENNKNVS